MLGKKDANDELRLCPSCRMSISVWATKCHYCGQKVSRPRTDEAKFTLNDLGGEISDEHKISGDVMSALEQFREEEEVLLEKKRQLEIERNRNAWFAKKAQEEKFDSQGGALGEGLPELDDEHKRLAEAVSPSPYESQRLNTPQVQIQKPSLPWEKIFIGVGITLGFLCMYLVIDFAAPKVAEYWRNRNKAEEISYTNRALTMLEAGAPSIEALQEANEALGFVPSEENQAIALKVRTRFGEDINALLSANPWQQSRLDQASKLVNQALSFDSDPAIRALLDTVNREMAAYKMVLKSIDKSTDKATFILHNPFYAKEQESGGPGDYIQERFLIKGMTGSTVRLEDTKVSTQFGYRKLLARPLSPMVAE